MDFYVPSLGCLLPLTTFGMNALYGDHNHKHKYKFVHFSHRIRILSSLRMEAQIVGVRMVSSHIAMYSIWETNCLFPGSESLRGFHASNRLIIILLDSMESVEVHRLSSDIDRFQSNEYAIARFCSPSNATNEFIQVDNFLIAPCRLHSPFSPMRTSYRNIFSFAMLNPWAIIIKSLTTAVK